MIAPIAARTSSVLTSSAEMPFFSAAGSMTRAPSRNPMRDAQCRAARAATARGRCGRAGRRKGRRARAVSSACSVDRSVSHRFGAYSRREFRDRARADSGGRRAPTTWSSAPPARRSRTSPLAPVRDPRRRRWPPAVPEERRPVPHVLRARPRPHQAQPRRSVAWPASARCSSRPTTTISATASRTPSRSRRSRSASPAPRA